ECIRHGVGVEALPGPAAFVPALTASGLPCDRFVFEGFLPAKKGRVKRLEALRGEPRTLVLYESPHRLAKALAQFVDVFGADRPAAVARELTKKFEEIRRGTLAELHAHYASVPKVRGEVVVVVGGAAEGSGG
ncbi:MAG: SAM-dependent methyltransferase, partial [Rhodothermales bacterium]|nr:SAM-dependent methyltransferase [Rhodothermales bacterium]